MRITREERSVRRSRAYFEKMQRIVHDYQSELIRIFEDAVMDCASYEDISQQRKNIIDSQVYQSLPRWAQGEIDGAFNVLMRLHYRHILFWTVMLDGERITIDNPKLQDRWQDLQEGEGKGKGCYAYKINTDEFVPFNEKNRNKIQMRLFS